MQLPTRIFCLYIKRMVREIMSTHSSNWVSLMTSGGAKRMISPRVGFASKPSSRNLRQTFQASNFGLMTMALRSPLPLTRETRSVGNLLNSARKIVPKKKRWYLLQQAQKDDLDGVTIPTPKNTKNFHHTNIVQRHAELTCWIDMLNCWLVNSVCFER